MSQSALFGKRGGPPPVPSPDPPQNLSFDGGDLAATEDFLSRAYAKASLTAEPGQPVSARIERRCYGSISFDELAVGFTMSYDSAPLNRICLGRVHRGRVETTSHHRGSVLRPGDVGLVCWPELPFSVRAERAGYDLTLFDTRLLDRVAGRSGEPVRLLGERPVSSSAQRHLEATIDYVRVLTQGGAPPNRLVAATTAAQLAAAVLSAFPNTLSAAAPDPADRTGNQPALLRRAITFIEDNADSPVVLSDVADHVHVTARALQYMFRRHLQMTPMEYLRRVRMDQAHQELLAADPATTTVAHIAARWGFAHTGRFAAAYRRTYGRMPSDTLRF
ncbi:MAG: helix-turn-helix transcriptional regulator [Actinomycetota bacterium]|nr:helix-turn-helix transcriptional regulator [Actinomycetota bacterium]